MFLIPYKSISLQTTLAPEAAIDALKTIQIAPNSYTGFSKPAENTYTGFIEGNQFFLMRLLDYQNSFQPEIVGQVLPNHTRSIVKLIIKLRPVTWVFFIIWTLIVAGFSYLIISVEPGFPVLVPLVMLLASYLLLFFAYRTEAKTTIRHFKQLYYVE